MDRARVVTICGDPGGASALAPVIQLLETKHHFELKNFSYLSGIAILNQHKIIAEPVPETFNFSQAVEILKRERAAFVLTATSLNGMNWENTFISAAHSVKIPTLSVLDFWSNYSARFKNNSGQFTVLPDVIAVMDERARVEIESEGIPPEKVRVTGQPAFERVARSVESFSQEKCELKKTLGIQPDSFLISFISQPFQSFYPDALSSLGFNEHMVLDAIITALNRLNSESPQTLSLVIKPHPRESDSNYSRYLVPASISICLGTHFDTRMLIQATDVVVGMNSALLLEACLMGKAVVSVQPGLKIKDPLPTNEWRVSSPIYEYSQVEPVLEQLIQSADLRESLEQKSRDLRSHFLNGAAAKIVEVIEGQLKRARKAKGSQT